MKFSLDWLREYVELGIPAEEMLESLTLAGTEVEAVELRGLVCDEVVVAEVLSYEPHPNADRLRVCRVNDGAGERQIVCGAKNFEAGSKVPLALPGARVLDRKSGETFKIKKGKLRGETSEGMLCSGSEVALADDADGLLILPADAPVGKPLHEVIAGDTVFEVEVTPNRPDLLSYRGLARELGAIGAGTVKPAEAPAISFPAEPCPWKVQLDDTAGCPFYTATVLEGVQVGPSPAWLKARIEAMGSKPINNVVDITNFVLWETGQPLHAFDADKLAGDTLFARPAKDGEPFKALDEETYTLEPADLVIADASGPVALAGVMGGLDSGVTGSTTRVVLEAAWFAPGRVRHTSRRLGLMSDSSYRFERRVDPAAVTAARDRAIGLLQELAGAKIVGASNEAGIAPAFDREVTLRTARLGELLGIGLPAEKVRDWLLALGLEMTDSTSEELEGFEMTFRVPSYRADLEREVDLIEEIARISGLDGIPGRINHGLAPESDADRRHDRLVRLRHTLAARGWNECATDSLVQSAHVDEAAVAALVNPLNEQYTHLRTGLKHSLLAVAATNLARGNRRLRLFEADRVYHKAGGTVAEPSRLGLLVAGEGDAEAWWQAERPADFFDLKGALDFLAELGLGPDDVVEAGRVARGEAKAHGIKADVFYAELALDTYLATPTERALFQPLPQFPEVRRDLAVVVPRETEHATVAEAIAGVGIAELRAVKLFDVFTDDSGEKIDAGRKSLAYALTYRADDRTLTDKEVAAWQDRVREHLTQTLGCDFRDA